MLFILNGSGVPSVASFVRFPAPWEDTQPPTAPGALDRDRRGQAASSLSWVAATDNVGVARYDVYRSTTPASRPRPANRIGTSAPTTYTDTGVAARHLLLQGPGRGRGRQPRPASNEASATDRAGDTTPPTVSITAPAAGATVTGDDRRSTASASDNVGVVGVQFKLDGANLGAEDTTSPYSVTWDTATVANGTHTLTAVARDAAGNSTTSAGVARHRVERGAAADDGSCSATRWSSRRSTSTPRASPRRPDDRDDGGHDLEGVDLPRRRRRPRRA